MQASFNDGKWSLTRSGKTLVTVPEYPSFAQLFDGVAGAAKPGDAGPEQPLLLGDAARGEMEKVDAEWLQGSRSPELLRRAAHVLVSMAFELDDVFGLADELPARAIAAAARARQAGVLSLADQALLASALGYEHEARALAKALPAESAVRLYLLGEDAALEKAGAEASHVAERYLYARRVAARGYAAPTLALFKSESPDQKTLPFLFAHLRNGSFDVMGRLGDVALRAATDDILSRAPRTSEPPKRGSSLALADEALSVLSARRGALFDGQLERATGRARLASALWATVRFQYDRSEGRAIGERVKALAMPTTQPWGDLLAWMAAWGRMAERGKDPFAPMFESGLRGLDPVTLSIPLEMHGDLAHPETIRQMRLMARRMDTRPTHRVRLAQLLAKLNYDFSWRERTLRRVVEAVDSPSDLLWLASADNDLATIDRLASDTGVAGTVRIAAVQKLFAAKKVDLDEAARRMRAIVASLPEEAEVKSAATAFLGEQQRWSDVRDLHAGWLARHSEERTMTSTMTRVSLARALVRLNRPKEAWPILQPALEYGQGNAFEVGMFVKFALGERAEALALEQEMLEAYPGNEIASLRPLWYAGENALAAERFRAIQHHSQREGPADTFLWVFGTRPLEQARAAIDAIPEPVPNSGWYYFIRRLNERKRFDLAALVVERKRKDVQAMGHRYLEYVTMYRAQGAAGADRWLGDVPPDRQASLYEDLGLEGAYDIMVDPPRGLQKGLESAAAAYHQAVAFAWQGVHAGPAWEASRARAGKNAANPEWIPTRVMLGLEPKEALQRTPPGFPFSPRFTEAALLEGTGHRDAALEAYLDIVDLPGNTNDYNHTVTRLQAFRRSEKSLKRLMEEGL